MTDISRINASFRDPDEIQSGDTISGGNFSQLNPNTEIMVGKNLTINSGNFTNVKQQPEWIINGGNWNQVSKCSHINPKLMNFGLVECGLECEHMTDKEELRIDDILVDTIYIYEDLKL